MEFIKKWDIVDDTSKSENSDYKYLVVTSSNKDKVYGFSISKNHKKMHSRIISIRNTHMVKVIGKLDLYNIALNVIENFKEKNDNNN